MRNKNRKIIRWKLLFAEDFKYRINDRKLHGKPHIVLKKYNTVIFVNGCFWHGHQNCRYFVVPKTRTEFWTDKIKGNKERDHRNISLLKEAGWNVITVWECELKKIMIDGTLNKVKEKIKESIDLPSK